MAVEGAREKVHEADGSVAGTSQGGVVASLAAPPPTAFIHCLQEGCFSHLAAAFMENDPVKGLIRQHL